MSGEEAVKGNYHTFRDHVREAFYFKVRFQPICESEYNQRKAEWEEKLLFNQKILNLNDLDADTNQEAPAFDSQILGFLLEMDEKLDQVIAHLTGKEMRQDFSEEAIGVEISGGGMKIRVEKPLAVGQLIRATLLLSRIPFVRVQTLGKVIHVKQRMCNEKPFYDAGVHFLDLDGEERDRIISCVFQRQREGLRKRKSRDEGEKQAAQNKEGPD
jgi:hypothetical protein